MPSRSPFHRSVLLCLVLLVAALPALAQMEMPRTSPHASVMQRVGITDVTIEYHRPGTKGRVIYGDLVPWDQVWRTGANDRTTITFSQPVKIGARDVPAGTYGLLTVPGQQQWTVVINEVASAWGAGGYDQAQDVARVQVTPRQAAAPTEWLEFGFENLSHGSADVVMRWGDLEVPFTVTTATEAQVAQGVVGTLSGAAEFCAENDGCDGRALPWARAAAEAAPSFWSWRTLARLHATQEQFGEAIAAGEKALAAAAEMPNPPPASYVQAMEGWLADWRTK